MNYCLTCGALWFSIKECPVCRTNKRNKTNNTTNNATNKGYDNMGFRTVLTPDDLKKGDLVEPGWYDVVISNYEEKEASTDKSVNCVFHFKIESPVKYKGYQATKMFNEKALGFGKTLWATLGFPFDPEKGYDLSSDLFKQTVGSRVKVYIARGKSDKGNEFNDVKDFKALDAK